MEDIAIGRVKWTDRTFSSSVGAGASSSIFPADSRRTNLIFTSDGSGRLDLFASATVSGSPVLTIPAVPGILELDVEQYGSLIMGPWSVNNPTAAAILLRAVSVLYDSERAPQPGSFRK